LEQELGVKLFNRAGKSVKITEAGSVFLKETRTVLSHAEDAIQAVHAEAGGERGKLQVGYTPSPTLKFVLSTDPIEDSQL
jgi:DNA-binding transcriptional LysR family regulator